MTSRGQRDGPEQVIRPLYLPSLPIDVGPPARVVGVGEEKEASDEDIYIAEIRDAILNGEILERYPDTGRSESCLILGFAGDRPIHVVCGWRHECVLVITVYVPKPPKFIDPWTRGRSL